MKIGALILGFVAGENFQRQFVGDNNGEVYTVNCPLEASDGEITVANKACIFEECPELTLVSGAQFSVSDFDIRNTGSIYSCNQREKTADLMLVVLETPTPSVGNLLVGSVLEEQTEPMQLAQCLSGYSSGASVTWKNEDGSVAAVCTQKDNLNAEVCLHDKDPDDEMRIQTELYLVANIKKGEGSRYFCEVTYSTAVDGQKAEETIKIMYPETGCIGIAGSECKEFKTDDVTKTPVFDTPVAIANKNPSSESPSFTSSSTELPHDTTDASHASALLGTATGIVIFAIIVILVWFIRKKTMAESGSQAANDKDTYAEGKQTTEQTDA